MNIPDPNKITCANCGITAADLNAGRPCPVAPAERYNASHDFSQSKEAQEKTSEAS